MSKIASKFQKFSFKLRLIRLFFVPEHSFPPVDPEGTYLINIFYL